MEWFLLWAGINFLIGYLVGKPKGVAGECALLCVLLGPIGWMIALCWNGRTRACPYCSELVLITARVCRHCSRDLPLPPRRHGANSGPPRLSEKYDLSRRRMTPFNK